MICCRPRDRWTSCPAQLARAAGPPFSARPPGSARPDSAGDYPVKRLEGRNGTIALVRLVGGPEPGGATGRAAPRRAAGRLGPADRPGDDAPAERLGAGRGGDPDRGRPE